MSSIFSRSKGSLWSQINPELRIGTEGFDPKDPQFSGQRMLDRSTDRTIPGTRDGPWISGIADHIQIALESIYRYNYKRTLVDHDNVERTSH